MGLFDFILGRQKTSAELLRENRRTLNRALREIDREHSRMELEEKRNIAAMKRSAKLGQMNEVKTMARSLVRSRLFRKKFVAMRSNINNVAMRVQTLKSQDAMAQAMLSVGRVMASMNRQLNLPAMQQIMQDFERQSVGMDLKEELLTDALDDTVAGVDEEQETDQLVQQILDEIGIQTNGELNKLPAVVEETTMSAKEVSKSSAKAQTPVACEADKELQSRVDKLLLR